jgi:hypothetical protein
VIRERAGVRSLTVCRAILPLAAILLSAGLVGGVAAQSSAQPPTAQNAAAHASPPPAAASSTSASVQENSNAAKPPKKRKVFTDDDLAALHAKGGIADDGAGSVMIYGTLGACDLECEQEVKNEMQVTPEQEGEWKLQMTAARREIGEDRQWRELYGKGQQVLKWVCTLHDQEINVPLPSGNDYQSRLERARQQKMFEEQELASERQMQNLQFGMSQYIQQISASEPVRAVMMDVIARRLFDRCPQVD